MKTIAIAILVVIFLCGTAQAEWVAYATWKTGATYYDPDRIIHLSNNKANVWKKYKYTSEEIDNFVKETNVSLNNYSYTLIKHVYDCTLQKAALSSVHIYSSDNKNLYSRNFKLSGEMGFIDVVPGTSGELLMNIVCKK